MAGSKLMCPSFITQAAQGEKSLRVVVVGAGGTGSSLLGKLFQMNETIVRLGGSPLDVVVFDSDEVTPANTGRQAFYGFDVGRNKAEVLVERFNQFGQTSWGYVPEKFTAEKLRGMTSHNHSGVVLFGCVDNAQGRIELHNAMNGQNHCMYIDCGNDNRSGNVVVGLKVVGKNQNVYYPTVYDLYKSQLDLWTPVAGESCSHEDSIRKQDFGLNDSMALYASQVLWQLVRHGECAYQTLTADLETGTVVSHGVDAEYWSMYGFIAEV